MQMQVGQDLPVVLRVADAQRVLGVCKQTMYEIIHSRGFPLIKLGRAYRIPRDSFLRWLEEQAASAER